MVSCSYHRLGLEEREQESEGDVDVVVAPEEKEFVNPPSLYDVVLVNDDFTPMDFVIEVLKIFFSMPTEKANQIMLQVHNEGAAICGTFSKDVAETKSRQVNQHARESQHPLLCKIKKAD